MKIHIYFPFVDGPWGGGNQFLKALRSQWRTQGCYAETLEHADACLINAFPSGHPECFIDPLKRKLVDPHFKIFYRLDGLYYRNRGADQYRYMDDLCTVFANQFVDGVIYQTKWIKKIQQKYGISSELRNVSVVNAPDDRLFNRPENCENHQGKTRLVVTCWAPNARKGFNTYQWLDQNLDFKRYELTFIGNTPVPFDNIKVVAPLPSDQLAQALKQHDIFISAAVDEPCSNSIVEAVHTGLKVLGHNSGGTPELLAKDGLVFDDDSDIPVKLATLEQTVKTEIFLPNITEVAAQYRTFISDNDPAKRITAQEVAAFTQALKQHGIIQPPLQQLWRWVKDILRPLKRRICR